MIAADSSALIAYVQGQHTAIVERLEEALDMRSVVLPPAVLAEILSDPHLSDVVAEKFLRLPLLDIFSGYWERVGRTRAKLIAKGHKARLADTQIAQSCIDHGVPLLTADNDFRHFVEHGGLKLAS